MHRHLFRFDKRITRSTHTMFCRGCELTAWIRVVGNRWYIIHTERVFE